MAKQLDEGLMIAAERYAGANVHGIQSLLSAYKSWTYPICRNQAQADVLALRIRRILRGVSDDEAYELWKKDFAALGEAERKELADVGKLKFLDNGEYKVITEAEIGLAAERT